MMTKPELETNWNSLAHIYDDQTGIDILQFSCTRKMGEEQVRMCILDEEIRPKSILDRNISSAWKQRFRSPLPWELGNQEALILEQQIKASKPKNHEDGREIFISPERHRLVKSLFQAYKNAENVWRVQHPGIHDCFLEEEEIKELNFVPQGKRSRISSSIPKENRIVDPWRSKHEEKSKKLEHSTFLGEEETGLSPYKRPMGVNFVSHAEREEMKKLEKQEFQRCAKQESSIKKAKGTLEEHNGKQKSSKEGRAPEPERPKAMIDYIQSKRGKDIRWVNTKEIFKTDIQQQQNRLQLPHEVVENLEKHETENKGDLAVNVWGPRMNLDLNFKYWPAAKKHVLISQWHSFAEKNNISVGDNVEIWSFRDAENRLCFAVNVCSMMNNASSSGHARQHEESSSRDIRLSGYASTSSMCNPSATDQVGPSGLASTSSNMRNSSDGGQAGPSNTHSEPR